MDNFETLIEKRQYDLVIELTKGSSKEEDLLYRISAYIGKNEPEEALKILISNREKLYAYKPLLTMKTSFELRFILEEWDEAYEDIKFYENQPYVSQEVEEKLRELPSFVRKNERNRSKNYRYSEEEMEKIFASDDEYEILSLLAHLSRSSIDEAIPSLKELMISNHSNMVKTYSLLLLINDKYDEEVTLKKNGKEYHLIPLQILPPYDVNYMNVRSSFSKFTNDMSLVKIAITLLDEYVLEIFPERMKEYDPKTYALSFLSIAGDYLSSPFSPKNEKIDENAKENIRKVILSIQNIK
ncbi:MAG: hypothetical protein IJ247_01960 [Bacilli bacterium]|nr:hypothetical protein [Bacilli bacterium]